jgi:hypothetical protein
LTTRFSKEPLNHCRLNNLPTFLFIPAEHPTDFVLGEVGNAQTPLHIEGRPRHIFNAQHTAHTDQGQAMEQIMFVGTGAVAFIGALCIDAAKLDGKFIDDALVQGIKLI